MSYTIPTVDDFKSYFTRDFPYGVDPSTSILDADISRAQTEAEIDLQEGFFGSQEDFNVGFNYLTAHILVMNLRASSQGISGQFSWLENSKGVGGVSQSFAIPDRILANPELAYLTKTNYGMRYLMMILPQLSGQMFTVCGGTNP